MASSPIPRTAANLKSAGRDILITSAAVLFLELAIIRWGSAQVRVLAYFPNLLLVASFLGLGLGSLRAGNKPLIGWWAACLTLLVLVFAGLDRVIFTQESAEEHLWLLYADLPKTAPVVNNVWLPIITCFVLTALCFVPPGQLIARRLAAFKNAQVPLRGYSWDLLGSLVGASLFSLAAFSHLRPEHWFLIGAAAVVWLDRDRLRNLMISALLCSVTLATVFISDREDVYSPYYGLSLNRIANTPGAITANGSLHQQMIPMSLPPTLRTTAGYAMPYALSGHHPRHALVLGAGSGNDVAMLLLQGAKTVDAVEIDPEIINLGRAHHPNRPYGDPRVTIHNTDARAYLNQCEKRYDTIVFGTLDSMTKISALSNVRLDNFVYTTDCLRAAKRLLTDDGGMMLYFMTPRNFIDDRIDMMLTSVFDEPPAIHSGNYHLFNKVFMSGPAFAALQRDSRDARMQVYTPETLRLFELPDDDWPFLYLASRSISSFYLTVIALIGVISTVAIFGISRDLRHSLSLGRGADWPMFLFGFGFLLLETRSVTAMNLAWGTTWLTNAIVFASVLLTILVGTLIQARRSLPLGLAIVGLACSLLALYFTPPAWLLEAGVTARLGLSLIVVGLPILFASFGFAGLYSRSDNVGNAFGWNLLGAVAGGLAEFLSMITGLRALLLLALAAYLLAYIVSRRRKSAKQASLQLEASPTLCI